MIRHLFLVCYDISCAKRRRRALRLVKGNAVGGQKSVYECWLTHGELQQAISGLSGIINKIEDRVLLLRLDPRCTVWTLGAAVAPQDGEFFYQG